MQISQLFFRYNLCYLGIGHKNISCRSVMLSFAWNTPTFGESSLQLEPREVDDEAFINHYDRDLELKCDEV